MLDRSSRVFEGIPGSPGVVYGSATRLGESRSSTSRATVLVAQDLTPSDTANIDPKIIAGIITAHGGRTSHAAIFAKGLGIPAIMGCGNLSEIESGAPLLLDARRGWAATYPSESQMNGVLEREHRIKKVFSRMRPPYTMQDGTPIQIMANVSSAEDSRLANENHCDGFGVIRTEALFLREARPPSVDEQVMEYEKISSHAPGQRVVFRTLDAGSDKPIPFLTDTDEPNPALGVRGYRTVRLNEDVLQTQLTAIGQLAQRSPGLVSVMAPMISTVDEAEAFVQAAHSAGISTAGIMIEVPSAALSIQQLLKSVDFVSIGTNDLAQYLFAADRLLPDLQDLLDPWSGVLNLVVEQIATASTRAAKPVSVCGESASDWMLASAYIGMGIGSLSMAGPQVPEIAYRLSSLTMHDASAIAEICLGSENSDAKLREITRQFPEPRETRLA